MNKPFTHPQDTLAAATQVAEERISNIRTVRSFAGEMGEVERYRRRVDEVLRMTYQESFARGVFFGLVSGSNR